MHNLGLFVIQKNKKTMIKEKGKEICQRVLDTNGFEDEVGIEVKILYTCNANIIAITKAAQGVEHFIHLHN